MILSQLEPEFQRKGLGKFIMTIVELIARKQRMQHMMIPLVKGNPAAFDFIIKKIRGFAVDAEYGEDETQSILSKSLAAKAAVKRTAATSSKDTSVKVDEATKAVSNLKV